MKRRVVKVGGSLLEVQGLGESLAKWLKQNADMQNVIVVGGGKAADLVRANNESLTDEHAHRLALKAMSVTANLISCVINDRPACDDFSVLKAASEDVVFDSSEWILTQPNVPASWDFTSDSIAARLATELDADELVLIKSRMGSIDEPGFVDGSFTEESKSIKSVRVCTLNE